MSLLHGFKRQAGSASRRRKCRRVLCPQLEALEDRCVLSLLTPVNPSAVDLAGVVGLPPAAPSFTATAVSSSEIDLSWNSVAGANGYLVDEWINGAWQQIGDVDSSWTGCAVTGLNAATTYYLDVGAYNSSGTAWANYTSALTFPDVPSFTATAVSSSQVNLSWNSVVGASGYLVDEWIDGAWQQIGDLNGDSTGWAIPNLKGATTYFFQVAAYNSSGASWANYTSVLTFPDAPSFTATAVSSSQVNLSWNSVAGASGYLVDEWNNGAWQPIADLTSDSTGWAVGGLNAATTYDFTVAARNSAGASWANSTSVPTCPAAPAINESAAISSSEIILLWNPVDGASGYLVDEWVNGAWQQIANLDSNWGGWAVTGLHAATTYAFKVGASNSSGATWANTSILTWPAAPSFTATDVSTSEIKLSWNRVDGADGYLVDEWEWINGDWGWQQIAQLDSSSTSLAVKDLYPATTYYFDVAAYNNTTGTTWADYQSVLTWPVVPPFSFTATAVSSSQVNLSWTGVAGASGYLVDEWIDGRWKQIANLNSGSTSWAVTHLNAATTYFFDVAAYNSAGTSWAIYSSALTFPTAPTIELDYTAAVSPSEVILFWDPVDGASGYLVDEWVNGAWQQIADLDSGWIGWAVTGLHAATTCNFKVAAYNSSGATWGNDTSLLTWPSAPSFTATAEGSAQVNLSWDSVAGASGYRVYEWEWIKGDWGWQQIAQLDSSSTSLPVKDLEADTTYYFEVAACNSAGETWPEYTSVLTFPAAPSFTAAAVSSSQVNLSWNSVAGASGYLVDEWVNGAWKPIADLNSATTNWAVPGLNAATTYYFDVAAYNLSGPSWASYKSVLTLPADSWLVASARSTGQINRLWAIVANTNSYLVGDQAGTTTTTFTAEIPTNPTLMPSSFLKAVSLPFPPGTPSGLFNLYPLNNSGLPVVATLFPDASEMDVVLDNMSIAFQLPTTIAIQPLTAVAIQRYALSSRQFVTAAIQPLGMTLLRGGGRDVDEPAALEVRPPVLPVGPPEAGRQLSNFVSGVDEALKELIESDRAQLLDLVFARFPRLRLPEWSKLALRPNELLPDGITSKATGDQKEESVPMQSYEPIGRQGQTQTSVESHQQQGPRPQPRRIGIEDDPAYQPGQRLMDQPSLPGVAQGDPQQEMQGAGVQQAGNPEKAEQGDPGAQAP